MNHLLLISYFWPPSGKATVHWPLYIAKYLCQLDWRVSVLTVKDDTFSARDESLLADVDPSITVIRTQANDPFHLYRSFVGKKENEPLVASETISLANASWRHKVAIWIRMNLFIPDARVGWYFSAPQGATTIVQKHLPEVIVTIGPPHSTHLIGLKLSKKYSIPLVCVLIDPWVDIAYYRGFKRSFLTRAFDNFLEKIVMEHASAVVFVTKDTREYFCDKYSFLQQKSYVCYWGYNEEKFSTVVKQGTDMEILLHAGNIFDFQNPHNLWKALKLEIEHGRKLRLRFIGTVSPGIRCAVHESGLDEYTEYRGFVPYQEVVQEMMNASYLLVCATEKRHVPGKLFEYMRTGNKILAFGDDNEEVAELLRMTNSGVIFPYSYHCTDIFEYLSHLTPNPERAKRFSREAIAREFAEILRTVVRT
ncbi:MAG: glycosyltransferase [Bacteroidetes bacterium]|nr:glycosyltransferase [Bacteroidota bacterium]